MNIGFKTGPRNFDVGKSIVSEEGANLCEIWFDVTHATEYEEMISWLQGRNVRFGLHHWGTVSGRYKTNLMTSIEEVRENTIEQIEKTIAIAKETGAVYVNVHPGARVIETIDFAKDIQGIDTTKQITPEAEATEFLRSTTRALQAAAREKDVLLTIETLPGAEAYSSQNREKLYNPENASLAAMTLIAQEGCWIANDITHTAAQCALQYKTPDEIWDHTLDFSKRVFDKTRLVHINTVTPPHNGTDSHGGIKEEDFASERIPTKQQLVELLKLFKNREDVFVIPEPAEDPLGNYKALKALVAGL